MIIVVFTLLLFKFDGNIEFAHGCFIKKRHNFNTK